ncbi:MAG TPA: LysM peptidoglycan-binding domain-containing protein, partial [Treponemataceae bacterium]|nr:LysM peptidoglycan-binding domain-containing protein [Treponemataceae bacterium]
MKLINYYKKIKFLSSTRIVKNIVPILVSAIAGALCACVLTFCPSMSNMQNNFQMYENSQKKVLKKKGEINSFEQGVKTKTATETKTAQFSQLYGQGGYETPAKNQSIASLHDQTDAALLADAEMNESLEERTYSSLSYHVYRIKKGDMLGVIAEQFGITEDTLISVNNIKQSRLIQIGQYIKIPSIAGILYTVRNAGETAKNIAEKYEVNYEKLSAVNNIKADEKLTAGEVVFVPDAFLDWVT